MDQITITCPHCGFSKAVDRATIPARLKCINCPECKKSFQLEEMPEPAAEAQPVTPPSPGNTEVAGSPPPAAPTAPAAQTGPRQLPFSFNGNAREYFGIWIVNTLLKIVTFGIYSPWAKVRKRRYFYGNTLLDGSNFDYLANPLALLKGWLIGAAFFIVYSVGSQFSPILGLIFGLVLFFLIPWVIVRSRLFNNRNSAHRNVRFNFRPAYAEAYKVYAWWPLLSILTLGLLTPYVLCRQKRFLMENNSYGRSFFSFDAGAKAYYIVALKTIGFAILVFGSFFLFGALFGASMPVGPDAAMPAAFGVLLPFLMLAGYLFLFVYGYVRTANLTWNGTYLGKNRFVSTMRVRDMTWIMFSNLVASILSVGLLVPWASVRLARYRLDNLALNTNDDLDRFINGLQEEASAAGEEIGEFFDVDFGL